MFYTILKGKNFWFPKRPAVGSVRGGSGYDGGWNFRGIYRATTLSKTDSLFIQKTIFRRIKLVSE